MRDLVEKIDELIRREKLSWKRTGSSVDVELWRSGRKQKVRFYRRGDIYVFASVVVRESYVSKSRKHRSNLARRAWRRNRLKELVGFSFDVKGRLLGVIEQPVATLDHEELRVYIENLARECDRFEYALTGADKE